MALPIKEQTALDRALLERKELQEAIKNAASKLEKVEAFLAMYRQFSTGDVPGTERESPSVQTGAVNSQERFETMLKAILLESGRPLVTPEIIEKFKERGTPIVSRSIYKHMSNKLWRAKNDGVVENLPGKGYWPKGEPLPEEAAQLAEAAWFDRYAKRNEVARRPKGQAKPRPWLTGKGAMGRPRVITDEQLVAAENWILAGKMTRAEIAKELGGISPTSIANYFKGGVEAIRARRSTPPDLLQKNDAIREAARLRVLLAHHGKNSDKFLFSDLDFENARERLAAIGRQFPELKAHHE